MKIENGKLVLETCQCHACLDSNPGKRAGVKACPTCKGTGRGKRGGMGGCKSCHGSRMAPDFVNLVTCENCQGTNIVPETRFDTMTQPLWESLTFKVIREANGRFGFNESYLGLGYISTVGDYGDAWKQNDDAALIADVKKDTWHQACSVTKEDGTVCDYVAILVSPNGYKVKAVFAGDNPTDNSQAQRQIAQMFNPRQLAVAEAMARQG